MPKPLAFLIVEDSEGDSLLLPRHLTRAGYDLTYARVETGFAMRQALTDRSWDLIIANFRLPQFSAHAALTIVQQMGLDLPFIILSGADGDEVAIEAMRSGAHDVIDKGNLVRLVPVIERELQAANIRSQRRQALHSLDESQAILDALLSGLPNGFALLDFDKRIVRVNQALAAMTGLPPELHVGRTLGELLPDLADPLESTLVAGREAGDPIINVEVSGRTPGSNNQIKHLLVSHYPIRAAEGLTGGVGTIFTDITERKQMEQSLEVTADMQVTRLEESLVANVSHELRGPLSSVAAAVEAMADGIIADADRPSYYQRMLKSLERLARLTDGLLDLSKLDAGVVKFRLKPFDLSQLCKGLQEVWRHRCAAAGLNFDAECPSLRVLGDVDRIEQIIVNLLENAIRFTPAGGSIRVKVSAEGGFAQIGVTDSGIGIPADHLNRIWERFYTVDRARTLTTSSGTGLGLSITMRLVEQMQGRIWVESRENQGSVFYVRLPIVVVGDTEAPPLN